MRDLAQEFVDDIVDRLNSVLKKYGVRISEQTLWAREAGTKFMNMVYSWDSYEGLLFGDELHYSFFELIATGIQNYMKHPSFLSAGSRETLKSVLENCAGLAALSGCRGAAELSLKMAVLGI